MGIVKYADLQTHFVSKKVLALTFQIGMAL